MLLRDSVRLALGALLVHKLRTALTLIGLVIGVTSLVLVITVVQGADVYVQTKIVNMGADVFQVSKAPLVSTDFREYVRAQRYPDLRLDDWLDLQDRCQRCRSVGAKAETLGRAQTETQSLADVSIRGETANMAWTSSMIIARGRFFTDAEQRSARPVAILGDGLVEHLFPTRDPLGKSLRVGGEQFLVIGVAEKIGSILGQEQDNFVVLPLDAFARLYGLHNASLMLEIKAASRVEEVEDEARLILRSHRHVGPSDPDNFFFTTAETYLSLWRDISSVFFLVLVLISSVASLVGGIVIMNITLVSVSERTKEIGLRRSLGARKGDIARQFLLEVLAQCLAGGLAGVLLGFAVAIMLRQLTPFPAYLEWWVALVGVLLASAIALIFGVYPAIRAARLDPAVALRSD
jgi:putative ABC transport system permease protein